MKKFINIVRVSQKRPSQGHKIRRALPDNSFRKARVRVTPHGNNRNFALNGLPDPPGVFLFHALGYSAEGITKEDSVIPAET